LLHVGVAAYQLYHFIHFTFTSGLEKTQVLLLKKTRYSGKTGFFKAGFLTANDHV